MRAWGLNGRLAAIALLVALPMHADAQRTDDEGRVSISGTVLDAYTDRPIEGVTVEVRETGFRLTTDAQGRFDLLNMAVGTYQLELSHPRYHPAGGSFRIMRPGEFTTRLEPLELEGEGLVTGISGVVTDGPGGSPVVGASVFVDDPAARSGARTDGRGRFLLDDLSPGPARVEFAQIGYATRSETIEVVPGRVANVRVALSPDPVELVPIEVAVERREVALQDVGFYDRRAEGFAEFIDRAAIETLVPAETTDIFTRMPGVELYADPNSPMDRYIVLRAVLSARVSGWPGRGARWRRSRRARPAHRSVGHCRGRSLPHVSGRAGPVRRDRGVMRGGVALDETLTTTMGSSPRNPCCA